MQYLHIGERVVGGAVQVGQHLRPDLLADLVGGALPGRAAKEQTRRLPVGNVHREQPLHPPVAITREVDPPPELVLGNRGQGPRGVGIDGVAVDQRHVVGQVKLHAVHPGRARLPDLGQRGRGLLQLVGQQGRHNLDGQRGDVIVGGEIHRTPVLLHRHMGDAPPVGMEALHGGPRMELTPSPCR